MIRLWFTAFLGTALLYSTICLISTSARLMRRDNSTHVGLLMTISNIITRAADAKSTKLEGLSA